MRFSATISRGVLVLTLTALMPSCGDSQPEMVVRAGSSCVYDGPEEFGPGFNKMRLVNDGAGRDKVEVLLYRLDGTTFEEVERHYESESARFVPPGAQMAQRLVLGNQTRREAESIQMVIGSYAVVCFYDDLPGMAIADITVIED